MAVSLARGPCCILPLRNLKDRSEVYVQRPQLTNSLGIALSTRQAFWLGLLFWVAIAALGIALRGIRWEETYERAQAITGMVPYPDDHPFAQYARAAIGFHYYLSAALMHYIPDAAVICGYRSVWSAAFALIPVYIIAFLLTRKLWLAHLSTLLSMAEVHLFFCSHYALQVWPDKFTAGTIGQGYALFILAAFMARRWRTAFLLLGLMPIVHIGHMPTVLGVGVLAGLWLAVGPHPDRKGIGLSFLAGLCGTVIFVLVHHHFRLPAPVAGPYFSDQDLVDAWRRYEFYEDIHRAPTATPRFGAFANSIMALAGLLLVSAACWRIDFQRGTRPSPFAWIGWYAFGSAAAVSAAKGGQWLLGEQVPFLIIGWLPFRSPNVCAVLLVPALVYAIACIGPKGVSAARVMIVPAVLALRPLLSVLLPEDVYTSYVAPPEHGLFLLFGLAMATLWTALWKGSPRFALGWAGVLTLCWIALAWEHQFGAFLVATGAAAGFVPLLGELRWHRSALSLGACTAIALLVGLLFALRQDYKPGLMNTPFESEVAAVIAREAQPGEIVLTPHWHIDWQEKLNQPVFATFETPLFLTYYRPLAATIEKMMTDAYDIRFGQPWDYQLDSWRSWSQAEWLQLAKTYNIRFVLAPNSVALPLTPVLPGGSLTLWRTEIAAPSAGPSETVPRTESEAP